MLEIKGLENLNAQDRADYATVLGMEKQKVAELEAMQAEGTDVTMAPESAQAVEDELVEMYRRNMTEFAAVERPRIFYILNDQVWDKFVGKSREAGLAASYDPFNHIIFVKREKSPLTKMQLFKLMDRVSHELGHASAKNHLKLFNTPEGNIETAPHVGLGLASNREGRVGSVLEEGAVVDVQLQIRTKFLLKKFGLKNVLPGYSREQAYGIIYHLLKTGEGKSFGDIAKLTGMDIRYLLAGIIVGQVAAGIPKGGDLVRKARCGGEIMPLARGIEKKFGKGSFNKIMSAEVNNFKDVQELLNFVLEAA